jgi:3-oxoacyl-[acyl-carrier protein] reductase
MECKAGPSRLAVVTGAGSGIGAACAGMLDIEGYRVAVTDMILRTAEELARSSPRMTAYPLDVRDGKEVHRLFNSLEAQHEGIDILVHCAGSTMPGRHIWDMEEQDFQNMIQVHLLGSFLCVKEAARIMVSRGYGRIVLIGSMAGITGLYGKSHYASAKAGMGGLTLTVAKEFIGTGVTINLIAPGLIETAMSRGSFGDVRLDNAGRPEDVAALVRFLTSPEASHINGTITPLDGGQSLVKPIDSVMKKKLEDGK